MGQPAARITAADFLIPPELHAQSLAGQTAGRIGGARLELFAAKGGTRLRLHYEQIPLRVCPLYFDADEPALVYLVNPTAGLMDGDGHLVDVEARSGSRSLIVGQSATRMHPCLHGFCTQQWRVRVEAGATLVILPGPAIPFTRTRFFSHVRIDLAEGARLIWATSGSPAAMHAALLRNSFASTD
jgi:urease accessory protein